MIFHQLEVRVLGPTTAKEVDLEEVSVLLRPGGSEGSIPSETAEGSQETSLPWDEALEVFFADGLESGDYTLEVHWRGRTALTTDVVLSNAPQKRVLRLPAKATEPPAWPATRPVILGAQPVDSGAEGPQVDLPHGLRLQDRRPFSSQRFLLFSTETAAAGADAASMALPAGTGELLQQLQEQDWVEEAGEFLGHPDHPGSILTRGVYLEPVGGTPQEALEELVSRHGLTELERLPVEGELYTAVADPGIPDMRVLLDELMQEDILLSVEPVTLDELEPHARIFDPVWDRALIHAMEARPHDPDSAWTPILAVFDVALAPEQDLRAHPEFLDLEGGGGSRVCQARSFESPQNPQTSSSTGERSASHGLLCAALAAGASHGVAPSSHVMLFADPVNECRHVRAWLWAAGLEEGRGPSGKLPRLMRGADIFSASFTRGRSPSKPAAAMLRRLTVEGRAGKGCLLFFSSGNSGLDIVEGGAYGASPYSLSIAASTRAATGQETFAVYSGFGDVDLCAPSGAELELEDEGWRFAKVLGAHYSHRGRYPGRILVQTHTIAPTPPYAKTLRVADAKGFCSRRGVAVLAPDGRWGVAEILDLPIPGPDGAEIKLDRRFAVEFPKGSSVLSSSRWLGTLTQSCCASSPSLMLDREVPLERGQPVIVVGPEGGNPRRYSVERVSGQAIFVAEPLAEHGEASMMLLDETHYVLTAGTSTSTPLCAGVAALVLQANPKLTWVEVRHILRTTAKKIDSGCKDPIGRWRGRSGRPGDGDPYYSRRYGFGRIDAAAAVERAKSFDLLRDLWIRRVPEDDGVRPLLQAGDSPDLWVRSRDPRRMPAEESEHAGLHEPVRRGRVHWAFARVSNRGSKPSLDAWVRFYVAPGQAEPYRFPDDFEPHSEAGRRGAETLRRREFLGEVPLRAVPAGGSLSVSIPWPARLVPPARDAEGSPWDPHLLVVISPLDGPLEGLTVLDCNNLAQRSIQIEDA